MQEGGARESAQYIWEMKQYRTETLKTLISVLVMMAWEPPNAMMFSDK